MAVPRLVAAVFATMVGLAFWWALTEPLPIPPLVLYGVPALILFACGVIAGGLGGVAAPVALVFSLLLGSLIATQLHQAFVPASLPVSRFGGLAIDGAARAGLARRRDRRLRRRARAADEEAVARALIPSE